MELLGRVQRSVSVSVWLIVLLSVHSPVFGSWSQADTTCRAVDRGVKTIANRMIQIRTSFKNGAEEIGFVHALSRGDCNNLCCSSTACDTAMYIGPTAAVWSGPTSQADGNNCALLACKHSCFVDKGIHHGIYISKIDGAASALPQTVETAAAPDVNVERVSTDEATVETTPRTSKVSAATTMLATSTVASATRATTAQSPTMPAKATVAPTSEVTTHSTSAPRVQPKTSVPVSSSSATSGAASRQHAMPTSSNVSPTTVKPMPVNSQNTSSAHVATAPHTNDTSSASINNATAALNTSQPSAGPSKSAIAQSLAHTAVKASTQPSAAPATVSNVNSRFSSTPTLVIALSIGLLAFVVMFFLISRRWLSFARTRLTKQKEDYLINGMYA